MPQLHGCTVVLLLLHRSTVVLLLHCSGPTAATAGASSPRSFPRARCSLQVAPHDKVTRRTPLCRADPRAVSSPGVWGTAEGKPFDRAVLDQLLDLGVAGCAELTRLQRGTLA